GRFGGVFRFGGHLREEFREQFIKQFEGLFSDQEISCVETVGWSWSRSRDSLSSIRRVWLVVLLLVLLLVVRLYGPVVGLAVSILGALTNVLYHGLTFGELRTRALPNEGIRRSARNAGVVGLVFGLVYGLASGLSVGLMAGMDAGLVFDRF